MQFEEYIGLVVDTSLPRHGTSLVPCRGRRVVQNERWPSPTQQFRRDRDATKWWIEWPSVDECSTQWITSKAALFSIHTNVPNDTRRSAAWARRPQIMVVAPWRFMPTYEKLWQIRWCTSNKLCVSFVPVKSTPKHAGIRCLYIRRGRRWYMCSIAGIPRARFLVAFSWHPREDPLKDVTRKMLPWNVSLYA